MYARLLQDWDRRIKWNGMSRTDPDNPDAISLIGRQAPETSRYLGGSGSETLPLDKAKKVQSLNTPEGEKYLERIGSGWVNKGPWPRVEELSFACNVVDVTLQRSGRNYVRYIDISKPLTDPAISYLTDPCLIHCFTVVTPDGKTVLASAGGVQQQVYLLGQLHKPGLTYDLPWYPDDALEFFPGLPFPFIVTVTGLNVRDAPAGNVVRVLAQGDSAIVMLYQPRGSAVWGRIGENEWIALAHPAISGWYSTTWRMKTLPPPVA